MMLPFAFFHPDSRFAMLWPTVPSYSRRDGLVWRPEMVPCNRWNYLFCCLQVPAIWSLSFNKSKCTQIVVLVEFTLSLFPKSRSGWDGWALLSVEWGLGPERTSALGSRDQWILNCTKLSFAKIPHARFCCRRHGIVFWGQQKLNCEWHDQNPQVIYGIYFPHFLLMSNYIYGPGLEHFFLDKKNMQVQIKSTIF